MIFCRTAIRSLRSAILGLSALGLCGCAATAEQRSGVADTVFMNGKVYTADAAGHVAEAMAIRNGVIAAVGSDEVVKAHIGDSTHVIDLGGRMLMPGLIDAHMHPVAGGEMLAGCSLGHMALTTDEILARLATCLKEDEGAADDRKWLRAMAWFRQATKPEGADLSSAILDRMGTDRPVAVIATDFHTLAANSAAMKAAGITRDTPNPSGGEIVRDEDGNPTGIFHDAAMWLLLDAQPKPDPKEDAGRTLANVKAALKELNSQGVTTIFDAAAGESHLEAFRTAYEAGELTARSVFAISFSPDEAREPLAAVAAIRGNAATYGRPDSATRPGMTIDRAKIFVDGVIQAPAQTGALLEPYLHNIGTARDPHWVSGEHSGALYYDEDLLAGLLDALVANGLSAHMHTTGDRAVHISLNAIETIRGRYNAPAFRPGLAHVELISPSDYPRFARLDAVPVLSLQWGKPGPDTLGSVKPHIGPNRFPYFETAGKFHAAGARIAFGSDWPIDPLDEWGAMQIGVTRENPQPSAPVHAGRLGDDPGLDIATAIRAFTINAAYSLNMDDRIGSLEPGKYADLIVIDRDLTKVAPQQIGTTKVLLTMVGGKVVYRDVSYR